MRSGVARGINAAKYRTPGEVAASKARHAARKAREAVRRDGLVMALMRAGLPKPASELPFFGPKKARPWKFDLAYEEQRLAIEVHGGTYSGGRHNRGSGMRKDRKKMNTAIAYGWRVLEFTGDEVDEDPNGCAALVVQALTWKTVRPEREMR